MFNILVCGDRNWDNYAVIHRALFRAWNEHLVATKVAGTSTRNIIVIHGAAKGADTQGGYAAHRLGFGVRTYPANWNRYKKGAGPIRNSLMLKENKIDLVLAFHDNFFESKGTKDMVEKALDAKIPVVLYRSDESSMKWINGDLITESTW